MLRSCIPLLLVGATSSASCGPGSTHGESRPFTATRPGTPTFESQELPPDVAALFDVEDGAHVFEGHALLHVELGGGRELLSFQLQFRGREGEGVPIGGTIDFASSEEARYFVEGSQRTSQQQLQYVTESGRLISRQSRLS